VKIKLLLAVLPLTCALLGQSNRGAITGTVSDSTGSLVPGVEVVLVNTDTGAKSDTVTTGTGNYSLLQLPVGTYTLTVEKAGFSKFEQSNIQVQVAVTTRVDVVLKVGAATESVTVTAESTLLKSESWRYDVVAVRGSRLAYVPRAAFERLLNTSLAFNRSMLAQMNARLSLFIGLAVYDRLLSADTRVARCLASLFSSDLYPGTSSFVKLSQDEIGLLSAVSRQRANQALHALQQAGLLRIEFGGVTVLDVQGLWRFSGDSEVRDVPRNHR